MTLATYEFHGLDVSHLNGSHQAVTDCPLCGEAGKFYIADKGSKNQKKEDNEGQYDCYKCKSTGNKYSFLRRFYEKHLASTNGQRLEHLVSLRSLPPEAVSVYSRVAFDEDNQRYLFPVTNSKGAFSNLRVLRYAKTKSKAGKIISTSACKNHLYGLSEIATHGPIFLCEGEHDHHALLYLLSILPRSAEAQEKRPYSVLSVPGDGIPVDDLEAFQDREAILLFDNDEAGRKHVEKWTLALAPYASSIRALSWPEEIPPERKYDINDYVSENYTTPKQAMKQLLSWSGEVTPPTARGRSTIPNLPKLPTRTTVEEVYQDFQDSGIHLDPLLAEGLLISLAITLSVKSGGESLWLHLIGHPGRGKSLIIDSTMACPWVNYQTSIHYEMFISGANLLIDPSIIPYIAGGILAVKDYSNVHAMESTAKHKLFGMLREGYDGYIKKGPFGNAMYREYIDCKWGMLWGATPILYKDSHADLGSRFLNYDLGRTPLGHEDSILLAAIRGASRPQDEEKNLLLRQASVLSFLSSRESAFDPESPDYPTIPHGSLYEKRLLPLAKWVATCKGDVSRSGKWDDLDYTPCRESESRVGKQLTKLSQSLAALLALPHPTEDIYRLVRKVAWDTAHSRRRGVFLALVRHPHGIPQGEICRLTGYSTGTVYRELSDLRELEVVQTSLGPSKGPGRKLVNWSLNPYGRSLWEASEMHKVTGRTKR